MMYNNFMHPNFFFFPAFIGLFAGLGILLLVWVLYWKGRALWLAAKNNDLYWFIALLVINTLGILEILYIYYFSKRQVHHHDHGGHNHDHSHGDHHH